jgi:hypothetical protein
VLDRLADELLAFLTRLCRRDAAREVGHPGAVAGALGVLEHHQVPLRVAFRCTTDASSDIVLGHGRAVRGYTATDIDPTARGIGWLLAEGGIPRRMRVAYLTDAQVRKLAALAAERRVSAGGVP